MPLRDKVILVVDDDTDNLFVMEHVLTLHYGAAVHSVDSGQAALSAVAELCPALILTDLSMPGMNGFELLPKLRALVQDTPILALTAHAMAGDRERVLAAHFDDYIAKPFDLLALGATLERWLERAVPCA